MNKAPESSKATTNCVELCSLNGRADHSTTRVKSNGYHLDWVLRENILRFCISQPLNICLCSINKIVWQDINSNHFSRNSTSFKLLFFVPGFSEFLGMLYAN